MKSPIITLFAFVTIILVSCKKEKSAEMGSGGSGAASNLLTRRVAKEGSDSSVVIYGYNAQQKLISIKTNDVSQSGIDESEIKLPRNAQGIIQKIVLKSQDLVQSFGVDSIFYAVNYDASKSRYSSMVFTITSPIDPTDSFKDSTAFTYNTAGKLIQQESFLDDGSGGGFMELTKTEYTYDGSNNVSMATTYEFDETSGIYELIYTLGYEYDNKTNPLSLGNEAFLLSDISLASTRNVTKLIYDDTDPARDDAVTYAYVYNATNKPITGTQTLQSGGTPATIAYYYK